MSTYSQIIKGQGGAPDTVVLGATKQDQFDRLLDAIELTLFTPENIELANAAGDRVGDLTGWSLDSPAPTGPPFPLRYVLSRKKRNAWDPNVDPWPAAFRLPDISWPVVTGGPNGYGAIADAIGSLSAYPFPTVEAQPSTGFAAAGDDDEARLDREYLAAVGPGDAMTQLGELQRRLVQSGSAYILQQGAALVPTSIGAGITGFQATTLAFAQDAQAALPALSGITSLVPELTDPADVESQLSLLTTTWESFIGEVGTEGGPDSGRAKFYRDSAQAAVEELGVILYMLRRVPLRSDPTKTEIKVTREFAYTPLQESDRTTFMLAYERVLAAANAFDSYVKVVDKDLGSQLVLLQQALDLITGCTQDVIVAMDAVRIVDADRRLMTINGRRNGQTIGDLLDWTASFSRSEALPQLETGGVRAISFITGSIQSMDQSVKVLIATIGSGNAAYSPLNQRRTLDPLRELLQALDTAKNEAAAVRSGAARVDPVDRLRDLEERYQQIEKLLTKKS